MKVKLKAESVKKVAKEFGLSVEDFVGDGFAEDFEEGVFCIEVGSRGEVEDVKFVAEYKEDFELDNKLVEEVEDLIEEEGDEFFGIYEEKGRLIVELGEENYNVYVLLK